MGMFQPVMGDTLKLIRKAYVIWSNEGMTELSHRAWNFLIPKRPRRLPFIERIYLRNEDISDANISKCVYVDPNEIAYESLTKIGHQLNEPGKVYGGRWDKAKSEFQDRYKVRSMRQHFEEGVDWTETEYYERVYPKVINSIWRNCSSEEDLEQFFDRIDKLYEQIKQHGYKTQAELLEENPERTSELNNDASHPLLNEIGVNIGRDGEFLWQYGGQHRLCIAQLLELDTVPVQVLTRHRQWQKLRDQIRKVSSIDELSEETKTHLEHPDLRDIRPGK